MFRACLLALARDSIPVNSDRSVMTSYTSLVPLPGSTTSQVTGITVHIVELCGLPGNLFFLIKFRFESLMFGSGLTHDCLTIHSDVCWPGHIEYDTGSFRIY